jgi:nucleoside-diphosphate-sugar epimerase
MKKKILITGAAGFLGNLSKEYFSKKYNLILVDKIFMKASNFYQADITNYESINLIIKKEKPDIILHYASEIFDSYDKQKIYSTNINGTHNVYKSAFNNFVKNLIFTSTFSIYEKNYNYTLDETEPASCKNFYGLSKVEAERILLSSDKRMNVTIFRCPIILDKSRAHRLGVLFEFIKDNCALWILGKGDNKLQFLSANDLLKVIEKSFLLKGVNVFNIGTDKVLTIKEIFEFLIKNTKSKSKLKHFNKSLGLILLKILSKLRLINFIDYHNKILVSSIIMNISKVKKKLNYHPSKNNAELLLEAYNYYINDLKLNTSGSGKKPEMGFFNVIKFFSRFF